MSQTLNLNAVRDVRVRRVPSESLEDRLSDFPESKASLIATQARSELLDRVVNLKSRLYHDPSGSTIYLALPWHSIAEDIADLNLKIVTS